MPPKRREKTTAKKKEDAEHKKRMLATKEKIMATKRMILSIIEVMIEKDVSKEWFLTNCTHLCHADYSDVVEERSIEKLCGYPMCSNIIKQTLKQKYHISRVANKVYDLTERKYFCSNECYKASNYLRAQLSPIPLHMRKEEKIKIHLLSDCDNRGSAGEEIQFHHQISKEEVNKVYNEEMNNSNNFQNLLNEEIKKCADSIEGLQIKEHIFETEYVFEDKTPKKSDDAVHDDEKDSDLNNIYSDDDSEEERLFPTYDNVSVLSHRHMPIPEKVKRLVLIPPKRTETNIVTPAKELSLKFTHSVFKDWMTEDTLKFLMGEKYVYEVKADHLFEKMTDSGSANCEKLESIKSEYIKLCLKIDSLPDDDDFIDSTEFDIVSGSKQLENDDNSAKTSFKRRPKRSNKNKNVSFHPETKKSSVIEEEFDSTEQKEVEAVQKIEKNMKQLSFDEKNVEATHSNKGDTEKELPAEEGALPEPTFPLVDSVSQNILRRQILIGKLKSVYTELLPIAELHYTDIREAVRKFVDTLSLTPTNIIFKPKEWKILALVLFRVLTRTVLKDIHDELQFAKLCEDPFIPITIDLREIEKLVCDIVSAEDIINH